MSTIVVLGTGIVGHAAAWDLVRRGHDVHVSDRDPAAGAAVAADVGATDRGPLDASDVDAVRSLLSGADAVVSGVPYSFGVGVATAAVATGCHYIDFGGNPGVVARQLTMDAQAREAGVAVIPDCGLAPGLANVLVAGNIDALGPGPIDRAGLRVGAIPVEPVGALGYQLAFSPGGLINEYAEPCEILENGEYATVEPLTGLETVEWAPWGPLEAFHTAGGSSSLPLRYAGTVGSLDYKTLRFPGHANIVRAMLELGLFDQTEREVGNVSIAPRALLVDLLAEHLPTGDDDLVLLRTWAEADRDGRRVIAGTQLEDRHDGRFSALARTTAFPATALAHLLVTGGAGEPGARTMDAAVHSDDLIPLLAETGIDLRAWPAE